MTECICGFLRRHNRDIVSEIFHGWFLLGVVARSFGGLFSPVFGFLAQPIARDRLPAESSTGGRLGYLAGCRRSPSLPVGCVSVWMVLPIPGRSGSIQRYSLCGSPALSVVLTNSVDVIFSVPRHVMLRAVLALVQVAVSHSRVTIKLR